MKKCIIDVKFPKMPIVKGSKSKKHSHSGELSHGRKCIKKIQSFELCVSFGTRRALYRSTVPSALYLILYTHRHPIAVLCGGSGVRVHV